MSVRATAFIKLSVGSGIEGIVSNHVRPIRTVHYENSTDRLAECPTRSPSLSCKILDFEEIRGTRPSYTEFKPLSRPAPNLDLIFAYGQLAHETRSRAALGEYKFGYVG